MLYKFLSDDVALKVLNERQLKVSLIPELNDVYDCVPVIKTVGDNWDQESKKRARMILTQKIETCYGLLCFSRNYQSPIQWGHYAAGGTGIALGFDTGQPRWGNPIEVLYKEERPVLQFSNLLTVTDFGGLDVGIPQAMRRSIDFAANSHGIGAG